MKFNKIICLIGAAVLGTSCADFLDIVPDNIATIDYAFRDRIGAEKFLATCYSYLPGIGNPAQDPAIMGSDEMWNFEFKEEAYSTVGNYYPFYIKKGLQNSNSPYLNYWDGENFGQKIWQGIRNCNIFLDNVDKVGIQLEGTEKDQWVAEVKFLKAYYHFFLMRMYGPIPLMKENISIEASTEEVCVYRNSWDECMEYVIGLINEAVPYLPLSVEDPTMDMGRITQPIALSMKAQMLVTSASPLFNGNKDYMDCADNTGKKLFTQSYDPHKWEIAAQACKNAIDTCLLAGNKFYEFNNNYSLTLSDTTKLLNTLRCVYSDRFNTEVIWGSTKVSSNYQYHTLPFFTTEMLNTVPWRGLIVPSMKMVETFYSKNGVPINEDIEYEYDNRFDVAVAPKGHTYYIQENFRTAKINMNREPRFYANLAFDGSWWWGNGRYKDVGYSNSKEIPWAMHMKLGDVSGKNGDRRYSITGYWAKKPSHYLSTTNSHGGGEIYNYGPCLIRLSDLYLLYAEALNEVNPQPTEEVYHYIDLVRERAGLKGVVESWKNYSKIPNKPLTKEGMREIIQQERSIELCFESKRFWDLRRWKKAYSEIPGAVKAWNIDGKDEDSYYRLVTLDNLRFATREYLWPIKDQTLRINKNLVQNPYWEN